MKGKARARVASVWRKMKTFKRERTQGDIPE
jgi:hypothetical protein